MAYVIKKDPIIEKDKVCNIKLFLDVSNVVSKLRLIIEKILTHMVKINNIDIVIFKFLLNFVFCFTNEGPIDELKIVAGKDPTEKQAKNIAAISLG